MVHLTSGPALMVEFGLAVFCLLDALLAPEAAVRWLPRWGWSLALLVFPLCGAILWVIAGHSWRTEVRRQPVDRTGVDATDTEPPRGSTLLPESIAPPSAWLVPPTTIVHASSAAPHPQPVSVDAKLARQLLEVHAEQEQTLRLWEADLRRREAALRQARTRPTSKTV